VSPYILGDNIYPLEVHLQRGFTGAVETLQHEFYNEKLSSARQGVEGAFGSLKGRFRILQFPSQFWDIKTASKMVVACCIVHNLCETAHHDDQGMTTTLLGGSVAGQTTRIGLGVYELSDSGDAVVRNPSQKGKLIQEALLTHMADSMPQNYVPSGLR